VIRVVLASPADLAPELGGTVLFRSNVDRHTATELGEIRGLADAGKVDLVILDSALPSAADLVVALRRDPLTRATAIVVLGRSEFGFDHLDLLEAGANAILPLPPGGDWDDRLMRLIHVPVRKVTRFPVGLAIEGGLQSGITFTGRVLNLSVHGILLDCSEPLSVGEDLRFWFEMPAGHGAVHGEGTVVRQTPPSHFGVELTHVEGDGRVRIKRFVESAARD
jgi:CheY-like chemotaxis protein